MTLQRTITAGDSFSYSVSVGDYTGYTATLYLRGAGSVDVTGSESDGSFAFAALPAVTAVWPDGVYNYALVVSDGTDQYTIESGQCDVVLRADLTHHTDMRTHAKKVLESIEAVIEGRASKDQESYTIGGRSLTRIPIEELLKFRGRYKAEVARESGTYRNKLNIRM